jgi:osmotically inducible protein OsmC
LLAAAHAGCFTMKLSLDLTQAGFTPEVLKPNLWLALKMERLQNPN